MGEKTKINYLFHLISSYFILKWKRNRRIRTNALSVFLSYDVLIFCAEIFQFFLTLAFSNNVDSAEKPERNRSEKFDTLRAHWMRLGSVTPSVSRDLKIVEYWLLYVLLKIRNTPAKLSRNRNNFKVNTVYSSYTRIRYQIKISLILLNTHIVLKYITFRFLKITILYILQLKLKLINFELFKS